MFDSLRSFRNASSATKWFVVNVGMVVLIVLITTVYAYCRLDNARSYDTSKKPVEQVVE